MTISQPIVVFIHLGPMPCPWLLPNMRRTSLQFGCETILITDNMKLKARAEQQGQRVLVHKFTSQDGELQKALQDNVGFRRGFWLESARRFVALAQFHQTLNRPLLHIESDVLLLPKLDLNSFINLGPFIQFGLADVNLGSGAVFFSPNRVASSSVASYLVEYLSANNHLTEMHALGAFAKDLRGNVELLPTLPSPYSSLVSAELSIDYRGRSSTHVDHFGGIFDVAAIGQFLLGTDGRNGRGYRELYLKNPLLNMSPETVAYEVKRGSINVKSGNRIGIPILSLHVHSKDLRALKGIGFPKVLEHRVRNSGYGPTKEFHFPSFLRYVNDGVRHRLGPRV